MEGKKGCLKRALVGLALLAVIVWACSPPWGPIKENGDISKAINNARKIYFCLDLYAQGRDRSFPDGVSANEALRKLVIDQLVEREDIFGSPGSKFIPDGEIGTAPDYAKTLEPGENHWMYVFHREGKSTDANQPLLVEAPDMSTGTPLWHPERVGIPQPGRTWTHGRVIVCMADGSASTWKTEGDEPTSKLTSLHQEVDFADPDLQIRPVELPSK